MRLFSRSPTYTLPLASVAIECTVWNWLGSVPLDPQDLIYFQSLSNFATRELLYPSATKIFPVASQATSVGRSKLSPGAPAPVGASRAGPPPSRTGPGPAPSRAGPPPGPAGGFPPGAGKGAAIGGGAAGTRIASGFLPIVMMTWPPGSSLITMFEPSSITQMLSCESTRTAWAKINPYNPWPISRTYFPVWSNSNRREEERTNARLVPVVTFDEPVRVNT